jgi:hypothetical protein
MIEAVRQVRLRTKRNDHLHMRELPASALAKLPPIVIIGSKRKGTS